MITFDPVINLGSLFSTISVVSGAVWFLWRTSAQMTIQTQELKALKETVKMHGLKVDKLSDILIVQAVQDTKIIELMKRQDILDQRILEIQKLSKAL